MLQINKPSAEDLQPFLAEATAKQTVEEWKPKFLAALRKKLVADPLSYRAYGPYWPLLKRAFIDQGDFSFGETTDAEWFEALDYGDETLNLLAAFAYGDSRMDAGATYEAQHLLEDVDGEPIDFFSDDSDMEGLSV